jgi:Asp-tRNA(Asn)/Glu-tRNA(Gln) amidotransferase A subunit family amidase
MSLTDARAAMNERSEIRLQYAKLAALCDACITLSASGPAPLGLESTGSPIFAAPASLLGAPAISIPYFTVEGLPLGFQLVGSIGADATLFANAAALCELLANS